MSVSPRRSVSLVAVSKAYSSACCWFLTCGVVSRMRQPQEVEKLSTWYPQGEQDASMKTGFEVQGSGGDLGLAIGRGQ